MINEIIESRVQCPYCWEAFSLLIDASVALQEYTEDCEICCRPIDFIVEVDEQGQARVQARLQDE
ncbi:MAG: CPXCG motif-containing cysteine-rich protein [Gammaproteobacteria bacterium]|nr:CPXCG motif-containing cysteine-rich protein [Gammaproteobacteria bacterium]MDH3446770.1 CPXCG motif-containing cysteine-rich protein [Gammaproteobacteria bacterium]